MRILARWWAALLVALIVLMVAGAWWGFRPRATLEGAAARVAKGQYRAAEAQIRDYLRVRPLDPSARLLLARVLVNRPEPDPDAALSLVDGLTFPEPAKAAEHRAVVGDAEFWKGRYDRAELAWLDALRLEPAIAEVGWKLLNVYAIQGRDDEARRLGLRLFAIEPDPRDRVQLLLQLIRHDAHAIEAGSIVHELEPIVRANPADLSSTLALAKALIRAGRQAEGLDRLRRVVRERPEDVPARVGYLDALVETGGVDELDDALARIPAPLRDSPSTAMARGWRASQERDLPEAARCYRIALKARPSDAPLAFRLRAVVRQGNLPPESPGEAARLDATIKFPDNIRGLYDRLTATTPTAPDFVEVAGLLDQVGREPEAAAWKRLASTPPGTP